MPEKKIILEKKDFENIVERIAEEKLDEKIIQALNGDQKPKTDEAIEFLFDNVKELHMKIFRLEFAIEVLFLIIGVIVLGLATNMI